VDAIAADAGVAKMTVYNNFGSKEGLFQAAVHRQGGGGGCWRPGRRGVALARGDDALGALRSVYGVAWAQPRLPDVGSGSASTGRRCADKGWSRSQS
jgi:TetR/AcrR family transcriptional repressor of mexJK operon